MQSIGPLSQQIEKYLGSEYDTPNGTSSFRGKTVQCTISKVIGKRDDEPPSYEINASSEDAVNNVRARIHIMLAPDDTVEDAYIRVDRLDKFVPLKPTQAELNELIGNFSTTPLC